MSGKLPRSIPCAKYSASTDHPTNTIVNTTVQVGVEDSDDFDTRPQPSDLTTHVAQMSGPAPARLAEIKLANANQMALQPTINIGVIGHVSHGKSTLTKALSGVTTGRHHEELKRNMTIQLGYASFKIFRCAGSAEHEPCRGAEAYRPGPSGPGFTDPTCSVCDGSTELVRHVSLVDAPGHHALMATMLSGASIMDGCLLVVAANQPCPCPQTTEHLAAADLFGFSRRLLVVQNKVDLCSPDACRANFQQIQAFLNPDQTQGGDAKARAACENEQTRVIPVAAHAGLNLDLLCQAIVHSFPVRARGENKEMPAARFQVVRSFDVNQPGRPVFAPNKAAKKGQHAKVRHGLLGGVVGGSLLQGQLAIGDELELRPGLLRVMQASSEDKKTVQWQPLRARVTSLRCGDQVLNTAQPGGLLAVGLSLDPSICKADRLVGQTLGPVGSLPHVFVRARVEYQLIRSGVFTGTSGSGSRERVCRPRVGQKLRCAVGASLVTATVQTVHKQEKVVELLFDLPVCAERMCTLALLRENSQGHWRLMARGILRNLVELSPLDVEAAHTRDTALLTAGGDSDAESNEEQTQQVDGECAAAPPTNIPDADEADVDRAASVSAKADIAPKATEDWQERPDKKAEKEEEKEKHRKVGKTGKRTVMGSKKAKGEQAEEGATGRVEKEKVEQQEEGRVKKEKLEQQEEHGAAGAQFALMYGEEWPAVGSFVIAEPKQQDPLLGVVCVLPEYAGKEALVAPSELSRGKNVWRGGKLMALGRLHVAVVLRVDKQQGYIDLSRKRVSPDEEAAHLDQYAQAKLILSAMHHAALQTAEQRVARGQIAQANTTAADQASQPQANAVAQLAARMESQLQAALYVPLRRVGQQPVKAFRQLLEDKATVPAQGQATGAPTVWCAALVGMMARLCPGCPASTWPGLLATLRTSPAETAGLSWECKARKPDTSMDTGTAGQSWADSTACELLSRLEFALRHRLSQDRNRQHKQLNKRGKVSSRAGVVDGTLQLGQPRQAVQLVLRASCLGPSGVDGLAQAFATARAAAEQAVGSADMWQAQVQVKTAASPRYVLTLGVAPAPSQQQLQQGKTPSSSDKSLSTAYKSLSTSDARRAKKEAQGKTMSSSDPQRAKKQALLAFLRVLNATLERMGGKLLIDGQELHEKRNQSVQQFFKAATGPTDLV